MKRFEQQVYDKIINAYELLKVSGVIQVAKKYRTGQFVKVKVTGIQPYGAFVKTPDNQEGLIHISEVMNDYVHDVNQFLSKGQIVKAKVLSVDKNGKLNLTLKDNEYFKNEENMDSSPLDKRCRNG